MFFDDVVISVSILGGFFWCRAMILFSLSGMAGWGTLLGRAQTCMEMEPIGKLMGVADVKEVAVEDLMLEAVVSAATLLFYLSAR